MATFQCVSLLAAVCSLLECQLLPAHIWTRKLRSESYRKLNFVCAAKNLEDLFSGNIFCTKALLGIFSFSKHHYLNSSYANFINITRLVSWMELVRKNREIPNPLSQCQQFKCKENIWMVLHWIWLVQSLDMHYWREDNRCSSRLGWTSYLILVNIKSRHDTTTRSNMLCATNTSFGTECMFLNKCLLVLMCCGKLCEIILPIFCKKM